MRSVWLEQHNMVNLAGWGRGGGKRDREREGVHCYLTILIFTTLTL